MNEQAAISDILRTFAPPPDLTLSQWADLKRILSSESSAEPGLWYTERAEYQRGIMDAVSDPAIETVVFMKSAQVGATEIILNAVGFYIDQDPSPILMVQPTLEMAKAWSKDRLAPMIRDTPALKAKVHETKSRDADNTLFHKGFQGGHITISGANSPSSLAQRPIRVVMCDDVDRFPVSAGTEGDPINLAFKRTTTFWNRKRIIASTPTVKGFSRIENAWGGSDKRRFYVPCPHCSEWQVLSWPQVRWNREGDQHHPETARYECEFCQGVITDSDKLRIIRLGQWRSSAPFTGVAGFHLNELYSPWVLFGEIAANFLDAKKNNDTLKVWVNTSLGETWEDKAETLNANSLMSRREGYVDVPLEAGCLTCAVDVQKDRLELEVKAWGKGRESWGMEWKAIPGDPIRPEVWEELDAYLKKTWLHPSGVQLPIQACCIDYGYLGEMVIRFVKGKEGRHIIATKGLATPTSKLISDRPKKITRKTVGVFYLYSIGTHVAKESIFARLEMAAPGPGYMHYPLSYPEMYFDQLTSEKKRVVYHNGFPKTEWIKKMGVRNEALDLTVYNLAAIAYLEQFPRFDMNARVDELMRAVKTNTEPKPAPREYHIRKVRSAGVRV